MYWTKGIGILKKNVIRITCLPDGMKSVPATFAVRNPKLFKNSRIRQSGKCLKFKNSFFQIELIQDGKMFSRKNLKLTWEQGQWKPGDLDKKNLGGPFFSLDLLKDELTANGVQDFDPLQGFDSYSIYPVTLLNLIKEQTKKKKRRGNQP